MKREELDGARVELDEGAVLVGHAPDRVVDRGQPDNHDHERGGSQRRPRKRPRPAGAQPPGHRRSKRRQPCPESAGDHRAEDDGERRVADDAVVGVSRSSVPRSRRPRAPVRAPPRPAGHRRQDPRPPGPAGHDHQQHHDRDEQRGEHRTRLAQQDEAEERRGARDSGGRQRDGYAPARRAPRAATRRSTGIPPVR